MQCLTPHSMKFECMLSFIISLRCLPTWNFELPHVSCCEMLHFELSYMNRSKDVNKHSGVHSTDRKSSLKLHTDDQDIALPCDGTCSTRFIYVIFPKESAATCIPKVCYELTDDIWWDFDNSIFIEKYFNYEANLYENSSSELNEETEQNLTQWLHVLLVCLLSSRYLSFAEWKKAVSIKSEVMMCNELNWLPVLSCN